ncbi:acyltransferase family protein [Legionella sp. CNM-4043-24]|uniref:acyltransferase family protein n=1 Tax=Legionella sp. CNM-4043-24 TaxID=3421646 RepID=UPI00403B0B71
MDTHYRKDIDGLRAIAVLSVVLFHAFPALVPGGFIGVDVFFVISGFLISSIIIQQVASQRFRWSTFYIKRINRIFPALILVLLTAMIAGYFLLLSEEYKNLNKHILGSSFFLNNILLWKESGYFDVSSELKPLLHLWSLGIEEQFYLIWPVFIYIIWKKRFKPLSAITWVVCLSFLFNVLRARHHGVTTFYLPPSRFWELGLGGALACLPVNQGIARHPIVINLLSAASLIVLSLGIMLFSSRLIYPGWAALLPTLCTGILLATPTAWVNQRLLSLSALTFVGLISYPLYLWHWELLSFARIIYSGTLSNALTLSLLLASAVLAWLTWAFLENPIRFSPAGRRHAAVSAQILVLMLLSLSGLAFFIYMNQGLDGRGLVQARQSLTDDIKGFEQYRKLAATCNAGSQQKKSLTWCMQTRTGAPTKALWGDSHADHLFPGLLKEDASTNWLFVGESGCPPLLNVQSYWLGSEDRCVEANQSALKLIMDNPSIDTVVLASLGPFYISKTGYAAQHMGEHSPSHFVLQDRGAQTADISRLEVFYNGLARTVQALEKAGKKVVLFQDIPEVPFMPERCIDRPLAPKAGCYLQTGAVLSRQQEYADLLRRLSQNQGGLLIFNPTPFLCHEGQCPLKRQQHLLYRDSHHLSIAGSEYVDEKFLAWLNSVSNAGIS